LLFYRGSKVKGKLISQSPKIRERRERKLKLLPIEKGSSDLETMEPPMYQVIILNDDYTTMDFVVMILKEVYRKGEAESQKVMLEVHSNGSGIAGTYTKDIAETKISKTHQLARQNDFPLKCNLEKA